MTSWLMIYDVYRPGRFLNANIRVPIPTPVLESGVNQFETDLCFVARHS